MIRLLLLLLAAAGLLALGGVPGAVVRAGLFLYLAWRARPAVRSDLRRLRLPGFRLARHSGGGF